MNTKHQYSGVMTHPSGISYNERSTSCLVDKRGYPSGWQSDRGHWKVMVNGQEVKAHRVVWEIHNGPLHPEEIIDHKDGDPSNNLIGNLRKANKSQNAMNAKRSSANRSGHKGVCVMKNGYRVQLTKEGKAYGFGSYKDYELACLVADEARDKLHGRFSRHG